jgi:hypothetical protein
MQRRRQEHLNNGRIYSDNIWSSFSGIGVEVPPWDSMSFACGGWLQFYEFGVAKALQVSFRGGERMINYAGCCKYLLMHCT